MKTPESKQLSRRELIIGTLAASLTASCLRTTTRQQATNTITGATNTEAPPAKQWPEFEHYNEAISNYVSPRDLIADSMPSHERHLTDPDKLMTQCFESEPVGNDVPFPLDITKIPNSKVKTMSEIHTILADDPNLRDIVLHPASNEKNNGLVCVWYAQEHKDVSPNLKDYVMSMGALKSQLRILVSAQKLVASGVRFFGAEGEVENFPAYPDPKLAQSPSASRLSANLERETALVEQMVGAFLLLKATYPSIDLDGIDVGRRRSSDKIEASLFILKDMVPAIRQFFDPNILTDKRNAVEFASYLKSRGVNGETLLHDLKLAIAARGCAASVIVDSEGIDSVTPAIKTQLHRMNQVLQDPSFQTAQKGTVFTPNVFAIKYGFAHQSIPPICQSMGISCIEVNTTDYSYEAMNSMIEARKTDVQLARRILANLNATPTPSSTQVSSSWKMVF